MLRSILVPLDGSDLAERAVPFATRLARASGGRLSLLHIRPAQRPPDEPNYDLEPLTRLLRSEGLDVEALAHDQGVGTAGGAIVEAARFRHADLIVMSTHGRTGPGRWFYGGVTEETLRRADPPVLMIPTTCTHPWPEGHPFKILVPLDGSDLAEKALGPAADVARALKATLLLLRVADSREYPYAARHTYVGPDADPELAELRAYLDAVAERLRAAGLSVEAHVVLGSPACTIVAVAGEQGADLIAMRTHGHDDGSHLLLGDVAIGTLVRSPLPVLFVRSAATPWVAAEVEAPLDVRLSPSELGLIRRALAHLLVPEHDPGVAEAARALLARLEGREAVAGSR